MYGQSFCSNFDLAAAHGLTTAILDRLRELCPQRRFEVRRFCPNIVIQPALGEKTAMVHSLRFETGTSVLRALSAAAVWELFTTAYGPTKTLAASLDPERRECFKRDFIHYNAGFMTALGVAMPREYLLTLGQRK